jgi:hypothetical protein
MKILSLAVLVALTAPAITCAQEDEGTMSAAAYAATYAGHVTRDAAGNVVNAVADLGHNIAVPVKEKSKSVWGFLSDIGNKFEKSRAISSGDGVEINSKVYALALRQAERDNTPLTTLKKEREERQYNLKRALDETNRLTDLAKDYKEDAGKFQANIETTMVGIAESAKKLQGWDKAHQAKLEAFVSEHKKLGSLTADDGSARVGSHAVIAMNETWSELEDFIRKSPESARSAGLNTRMSAMSSLLQGAGERISDREQKIMAITAKINELSKIDESKANDEESMKRQMILGTLNNSVNNLIMSADFSKARSQMAFAHFKDIEASMKDKGVKSGDVKDTYKKNSAVLASQYNNTPFGVYVNGQIAKAMGSVCDIVNNQCKEGTNSSLFDFLDDSSRSNYKSIIPVPSDNERNGPGSAPRSTLSQ